MPTSRHEALRAAITHARAVLAEHPNTETSTALLALIAAAEPFANFSQAVAPPPRRVHTRTPDAPERRIADASAAVPRMGEP
ncbi:hypothetical protein B4N89_45580 [Embleya scabrispora]|uniref:Uncharacterized protein n=1 Tax=Embleya scabrispora TaxID=159449 RepID=A0A1T3NIU3_9ACTN|nr:hypothetical protein [Embleya scabrispora]OPC76756.1 hypothetical protein B4N89_45580 [Embleya scabrispora]